MASIIEFETSRLRMRRWRESDRARFAAMNADPAVKEFFASPPSPAAGDASIDAWQAQFACIASPGRNGASMTPETIHRP